MSSAPRRDSPSSQRATQTASAIPNGVAETPTQTVSTSPRREAGIGAVFIRRTPPGGNEGDMLSPPSAPVIPSWVRAIPIPRSPGSVPRGKDCRGEGIFRAVGFLHLSLRQMRDPRHPCDPSHAQERHSQRTARLPSRDRRKESSLPAGIRSRVGKRLSWIAGRDRFVG